ncbi:cyclic peptide export ABC transporter [Chitinasiproducens palmae]|uniref:Putative ATP-binding cassette transporter n=1 Tax=Chitinasiproducens palmae TaxID=1770053 RepID=A0A1H2PJG5_9BURK|nr:cyclic peptide export ABC transporter [Chitinasiproducens palmae]SDV46043.1 putative ATP-binding cassette transporter [Chitinasiproducens palmae]
MSEPSKQDAFTKVHFGRELFRLFRPFWHLSAFATALGVVAGLATAMLLAAINDGLHATNGVSTQAVLSFIGLCAITLVGNTVAGIGNSVIGQKIIASLRKDISARIVCAPIAAVERYRVHRLLATLNSDVDTVSAFTFNFPSFAVAAAVAIGCIVYMVVLSPLLFVIAAVAIAVGVAINQYASLRWDYHYKGVRGAQDELQKQYRAITEGAKELRLNRDRRHRVYGTQLSGAADLIGELKIRAMRLYYGTHAIGTTLFFLVIGLIVLEQAQLGVDSRVVSGFVIVLLYIRGPMDMLTGGLPTLIQARVSFQRIAELSSQFENREPRLLAPSEATPRAAAAPLESVWLRDASYAFPPAGDAPPFKLGPIDLQIQRGETLFIVGENGCGKTTMIKLLLSLYSPQSGALLANGQAVPDDALDDYRQNFSAVFSDYHLFDDLVASDATTVARATRYLEQLELSHKVSITDAAFSTTDLSAGQRKRLALVHAYLENRPWMVLDEWAADQDPTFRRYFYTEMLPDLKRQGKTLIVISHDDRYFGLADRVVRLHQGRIMRVESGSAFAYEPNVGDAAEVETGG